MEVTGKCNVFKKVLSAKQSLYSNLTQSTLLSIKELGLLITCLVVSSFSLRAQEKDFATWTNVGFEYKLKSVWELSGGVEWRTKDDLGKTDRWGVKVGGSCKLLPFLKLGAGYEMHHRNRGADGWILRHRYSVDGTLSTGVSGWKLSLRERFQHTLDGHSDELRLRSRVKVSYEIPKYKWEPYASVEMYNGLKKNEHFDVKRMRYHGGITLPLSVRWEVDLFYCRQWEQHKRKDIVGIDCTYDF